MTHQTTEASPQVYARAAGAFYLINIVFGFFAIGYVPSAIVVSGNAAATAHNIIAHGLLYRFGLSAHIIILLTNIPLAVIFYYLFKVVNVKVSLLVVFFTLVGTAIEATNLLNQFVPLTLLNGEHFQSVFNPEQLQSLAYMHIRMQASGFNIALVFFGFYCLSIGYLVFRSTFLPRIVGAFLVIGGLCYLFNSFAVFLAPEFAAGLSPYIQIPSGLAELTLCLWLLVAGLDAAKWKEMAYSR